MSESGIEEMLPKVDSTSKKKSVVTSLVTTLTAEREGFEPPEPLSSTVFKTAAIDHSAISPRVEVLTL